MNRRAAGLIVLALPALLASCASGFDLQGHRGARGLAPENTLAGFDVALATGVTTLELDTGVTKDGAVVIAHDPRLNPNLARDAAGRWLDATGPAIASLTLAELRGFDVGRIRPGTRYAQAFASQQPQDGERIPTLAALFERVQAAGASQLRFNIETKTSPLDPDATAEPAVFVSALLGVIRAHRMERRVTVQSFDWRTLHEVQRQAPGIPTVCLTTGRRNPNNLTDPRWTASLALAEHGRSVPRLVKAAGCAVWSPAFADLDAAGLAEARSLGLRTVVWTVNERADIERLLALGVDGIISDYPDRVRDAMRARGMALPPAGGR